MCRHSFVASLCTSSSVSSFDILLRRVPSRISFSDGDEYSSLLYWKLCSASNWLLPQACWRTRYGTVGSGRSWSWKDGALEGRIQDVPCWSIVEMVHVFGLRGRMQNTSENAVVDRKGSLFVGFGQCRKGTWRSWTIRNDLRGKNAVEEWLMCLYGEHKLHSWKGGVGVGVFGYLDYNHAIKGRWWRICGDITLYKIRCQ